MTKQKRLLWFGLISLAILIVFIWWQMAMLGRGLRTMTVGAAQSTALSAVAELAVDSAVLNELEKPRSSSSALLTQYREDPNRIAERAILTLTWVNASSLIKDLSKNAALPSEVISSANLSQIPLDHRTDGWHNPYCVLTTASKIVVMSSAGKGILDCNSMGSEGKRLVRTVLTPKLIRTETGLLATVQSFRQGS